MADNLDRLRKGIAAYSREQTLFIRLLRKRGSFTEKEFDNWFIGRELKRPRLYGKKILGNSFILGAGMNGGNLWAQRLELLQIMIRLGLVEAKTENGLVVYSLPDETNV